jgi:hypothetical protein
LWIRRDPLSEGVMNVPLIKGCSYICCVGSVCALTAEIHFPID